MPGACVRGAGIGERRSAGKNGKRGIMLEAKVTTRSEELVVATNALMATVASSLGRVAASMRETSAKLACSSERIKNAVPARRTA